MTGTEFTTKVYRLAEQANGARIKLNYADAGVRASLGPRLDDIIGRVEALKVDLGVYKDDPSLLNFNVSADRVREVDLWNHWALFALFVLLLSTEWFLRRRRGLA